MNTSRTWQKGTVAISLALTFMLVLSTLSPVESFVLPSLSGKPCTLVSPRISSSVSVSFRSKHSSSLRPVNHKYRHRHMEGSSTSLQALPLPVVLTTMQAVLHKDPTFVLSAVLLLSVFGISLEKRTIVGKALSAPLATMALALTVANLGIIPFVSPVCKYPTTN